MNCFTRKTNCFTRETLVGANRVRIHLLRVKPFVLRAKQKCYYILLYCFTRKTSRRQSGQNTHFRRKTNRFTSKTNRFTRKTKIPLYFNVLFYA